MRTSRQKKASPSQMGTDSDQDNAVRREVVEDKNTGLTVSVRFRAGKTKGTEVEDDSNSGQGSDEEELDVETTHTSNKKDAKLEKGAQSRIPQKSNQKEKIAEKIREKTMKKPEVKGKMPGYGLCAIFVYCSVLIIVVIGVIVAPILIPEELKPYLLLQEFEESSNFDYVKIFDEKLEELKMQFPNQTSRFWKILKTRGMAHLNDKQPRQPLVILMGAPPSAHNVIDCLAWKLAKILDPGNEDLGYIDGTRFSSYGGHEAKKIMDEKLAKLFQKGDRSALVLHLELLPPPSPYLFYSYCDNDNAPFKNAGMLFTVHLPEEQDLSLSPAEREGIIERYLSEVVWSKSHDQGYDQDAVSALLSRIADTVALVSGENDDIVQLHCPIHL